MPETKGRDHFCENPMCSMHQHKAYEDQLDSIKVLEHSTVIGWAGYRREREIRAHQVMLPTKPGEEGPRHYWLCGTCANVIKL